ncbi:3-mercaptopyruvate sulfurtransferase [Serratia marcescens]|uniref:3-mercaptopyruvate sulfurtransferase n=1 Tax=Serratia TaxID=613 RepID=UPI0018667087|nr:MULTISPECIES: 3-mercaptopyruvate sulfurtransferase [Serratia]EMB6256103.1 3-mercaptopyruvate sulfurtransferase [Serratia marcescens]MBH2852472.1 3-mercaptopyruvate sulfurtransferase [Serratia marcescens]MDB6448132.1 3-mercaptopyruvate sulfurtransferase [Serratia sp. 21NM0010]HAT4917527.1 3-mercaptopyruvate sulfurtransferase [Serratia marcescens]HAT4973580.1 3-mercaptopyruvate sulfurtransferase [Serratia marcescens]
MNSPFLVTPQWLAQHINDENLVVIDVRMSPVGLTPKKDMLAEFERGHIPGAVYFDIDEVADKSTALPHMLPTAAEFAAAAGQLGISERDTLVIYDEGNQFSAPRGWWTFRNFGAERVYVLDEGLNGWIAQGQALATGPAQPAPQTFNARFNADAVVDMRQVEQALGTPVQILDARAAPRFYAEAPEPRPGLHRGHIPGSINIPYGELLENGRFKSLEALRQTFNDKGVDINGPIITSCGSGVTAAVLAFGLLSLGAPQVKLYDGAWSEWGQLSGKQPIAQD